MFRTANRGGFAAKIQQLRLAALVIFEIQKPLRQIKQYRLRTGVGHADCNVESVVVMGDPAEDDAFQQK